MTEPTEALTVAKQFVAALARLDGEALCAVLDKDVVLENPFPMLAGENAPATRMAKGEAVFAHMRNMPNVLGSMQFRNSVWRVTDDGLAVFAADGDATLPNGDTYQNHYLMLFEVAGGKIVRWQEYYNPVIAARANKMNLDLLP